MKKKNIITVIGSILLGGPVVAGGIAKKSLKAKRRNNRKNPISGE